MVTGYQWSTSSDGIGVIKVLKWYGIGSRASDGFWNTKLALRCTASRTQTKLLPPPLRRTPSIQKWIPRNSETFKTIVQKFKISFLCFFLVKCLGDDVEVISFFMFFPRPTKQLLKLRDLVMKTRQSLHGWPLSTRLILQHVPCGSCCSFTEESHVLLSLSLNPSYATTAKIMFMSKITQQWSC